ncbi:MAG: flagellar export chaperone FliS [Acidobacteria bacterium]|nr:MAG: flagellar export chaperone FliS [Acidobacteriota bacterium]RPJ75800.1 MAG: flagellar export chaperone FliS [Acidobacteriota bacterium]
MQGSLARAARAYKTTEVQSQSPLEMVVLLYAGALRFMHAAVAALERGDLVAKREALSRALAIVAHLQGTLDMNAGGEVARSLDSLYDYVTSRLTDANVRKDPAPIREAMKVVSGLHEAWAAIAAPGGAAGGARP